MTDWMFCDSEPSSSQSQEKLSSRSKHGSQPKQQPVLGQPAGYGWNHPSSPAPSGNPHYPQHMPHPSQAYQPQGYPEPMDSTPQATSSKKRSSKGKEKDAGRSKSKPEKDAGKSATRVSPPQAPAQGDSGSDSRSQYSAGPVFRVNNYVNDPSQGPVQVPTGGAYGAPHYSRGYSPAGSDVQSERSHYRHDYERQPEKASSRRRAERHYPEQPPPMAYPPPTPYYYPPPHMQPYPPPAHAYAPESHHAHAGSHRSRGRYSPVSQGSSSQSLTSSQAARKVRTLTLLINDARTGEELLAELKVPVRVNADPTEGYWADAQEVCAVLQASASRIDGPAKVFVMRGTYKQIFLRVSASGEDTCTSANLKVKPDRTLEVHVEQLVLPMGHPDAYPESAFSGSRKRRQSTPEDHYVDRRPAPSPAPFSVASHPAPTPSAGDSRASSPMVVEETSIQPAAAISQRTSQGTSQETSQGTSQSTSQETTSTGRNAGSSSQRSGGVSQESQRSQGYHSAGGDTELITSSPAAQPAASLPGNVLVPGTPAPSVSALKPTASSASITPAVPRPRPKKPRHTADSDSEMEDNDTPRTAAPAPGFGFGRAFGGGSASPFGAFANYSQSPQGFGTSPTRAQAPAPTPTSAGLPRASAAQSELDSAVGKYLKSVFSREEGWKAFQAARNRTLTVAEQVEQYRYLKAKMDAYVGKPVPPEVPYEGAAETSITKAQVMQAFGLTLAKADECVEVLKLNSMYGPNGSRSQDPEAIKLYNEEPPISTNIQIGRYLAALRQAHNQYDAAN